MSPPCRVYVGNLPLDVRTREVEDLFYKCGRIRDIDVKLPTRPPAFAFVDFEDARDAQDAIAARNGYDFDGNILRVELANAGKRDGSKTSFGRNVRGSGEFALDISGLSSRASWQDLKDHMRRAGDVTYVSVDGRGRGYVEFSNRRDMNYALDKLDDTAVKCDGEKSYIRVRAAKKASSRSRSRSPERRSSKKARSHKRSASRSASRSVSASRSRSRDRKKSPPSRRNDSRRRRSASASVSPERKKQRGRSPSRSHSRSRSRSRSNGKRVARDERKSSSPSAMETDDTSRSPLVKDREEASARDVRGDSDAETAPADKSPKQ